MSNKVLFALVAIAFVAACAPKTEPVAPVTVEPVQTGKYK
ncbi:hypothetical protein LY44_01639 [Rhodobacter capsulatus]|jgi:uncharacterized lipoprotein YajG|uniref:Lipoprotein, putative n=3 Tax=Rhodobacter TaxID=1060 RepID=D5AQ86_RHOCB|nr:lipoprotein, putative [Rhodobacter capsulatus SB 1003]ETD02634.1 hypothetical protein U714_05730 [Rhodobacter capsulatus DE442]ETD78731.1 hypothetical protein U717_05735 [Rhodobacter capsulatus R121]ETD82295.1 hypothetical protein U703_12885 [Rhodobacter capsulatus YW1]ETD85454.1 hypothetical protein U716_04790 [Rhodobacter capsulatus B6]ETD89057.1 hypothetical protein U713_10820 [Rhodobacter capsulatus YW2]ETE54696.1 hypothetical protein U715_05725 [Rhodobacter capsulatus Y262]PYF10246.1